MFSWFDKQTIGSKIQLGFFLMGFITIVIVSTTIWQNGSVKETSDKAMNLRAPTVQTSLMMLNGINHSLAALRGWMILGQDKFKLERSLAWDEEIKPSLKKMKALSTHWTDQKDLLRLKSIQTSLKKFKQHQEDIEAISHTLDNLPANKILFQDALPKTTLMIQSITDMVDIEVHLVSNKKRKVLLGIMADVRSSTALSLANIRAFLIDGDPQFKKAFNQSWSKNTQRLDKLTQSKALLSTEQQLLFKQFILTRNQFEPLATKMITIRGGKKWNLANHWLNTKAAPLAFSIKEDLNEMIQSQNDLLKYDMDNSQTNAKNLTLTLWGMLFIAIIATVFFSKIIVQAIKKSVDELAFAVNDSQRTQWIQSGLELLNTEVLKAKATSSSNSDTISTKSLLSLCKYIDAGIGLLYKFDTDTQTLHRTASYAFVQKEKFSSSFKLGEASIGQVALDKKPMHLKHNQSSHLRIDTGASSEIPQETYTFALLYQDELEGVIEIGLNRSFNENDFELFGLASSIIATALATEKQNENIIELLAQAETSNQAMAQQKAAVDAHSIVGITDIEGTITYANSKFSEVSGYSNEELVGANHRIVNSGTYDGYFWQDMYDTISAGKVWYHPAIKNKRKDGSFYWVDTTIFPFMGADGKPESYIAIRTDVTDNKKVEQELLESKKEAEQAVIAKSEFLASMSHEIRTPMNGVIGILSLLSRQDLTKEQGESLEIAKASATSLLSIINDILDYSKIEAGKVNLEYIECDLKKEIGNFAKSIAITVQNRDVELLVDLNQLTHNYIYADIGRLKQVLNNLVGNAIKFTHSGNIIIKASIEPTGEATGNLIVSVEDSGIGIPEDKLTTLFDPFTQADSSTTRKYGGTGLGLSITKNLVQLMGGQLMVTSVLDKGSTFTFYFEVELSDKKPLSMPTSDIRGLKVLIVDDNKVNMNILTQQLKLWDIKVSSAFSAKEAIEICTNYDEEDFFDIAILDMQMPNIDGESLGNELSMMPQCKNMKMILMTSYGHHENIEELYDKGFNAFFMKPTTTSDLYNALLVLADKDEIKYEENSILTKDRINSFLPYEIEGAQDINILLVEDNRTNQIVAQAMLDDLGMTADIANNGQEALDILNDTQNDYNIVLMDCQMPVLDGFETTESIRKGKAGKKNKDVIIIAMTANAMEGDKEKCLQCGMNDYISKPIIIEVFKEILLKWIQKSSS